MAVNNICVHSYPLINPIPKIITAITKIIIVNHLPRASWFSCNGVLLSSVFANIWAILPTSVSIPVAVTTPNARP